MISPEVLVGLDCLEENSQKPEHEELIVRCLEELDNSFQWLLVGYGSGTKSIESSKVNRLLEAAVGHGSKAKSWPCSEAGQQSESYITSGFIRNRFSCHP